MTGMLVELSARELLKPTYPLLSGVKMFGMEQAETLHTTSFRSPFV